MGARARVVLHTRDWSPGAVASTATVSRVHSARPGAVCPGDDVGVGEAMEGGPGALRLSQHGDERHSSDRSLCSIGIPSPAGELVPGPGRHHQGRTGVALARELRHRRLAHRLPPGRRNRWNARSARPIAAKPLTSPSFCFGSRAQVRLRDGGPGRGALVGCRARHASAIGGSADTHPGLRDVISGQTLGLIELSLDGAPAPPELLWRKHLALLIYLARSPRSRSRDHLVALLWPEKPETAARHSLTAAISLFRRYLGETAVITEAGPFGLGPQTVSLDVLGPRGLARAGAGEEAGRRGGGGRPEGV